MNDHPVAVIIRKELAGLRAEGSRVIGPRRTPALRLIAVDTDCLHRKRDQTNYFDGANHRNGS